MIRMSGHCKEGIKKEVAGLRFKYKEGGWNWGLLSFSILYYITVLSFTLR